MPSGSWRSGNPIRRDLHHHLERRGHQSAQPSPGADPDTAKILVGAILGLATNPRPTDSKVLGGTDLRRLRLGDHRILYEISEAQVSVHVITVGSVKR
ncbi:mRNA-degrading endonuclease RelE of RelBE toxin-antitoxin system [Kribbella sp. VKM Ac-2569]|nr:mRNA-degrading endonuclease RelE of RelBE toxin-antitoxin system [Kribbella sp. VKM Ac-2569]